MDGCVCGGRGDDDHVALAANDVDLVRRGWIDGVKEPSWLCRKARWIQVRIPPMRFLLSFQVVIQLFAPPVPECYDYLKVKERHIRRIDHVACLRCHGLEDCRNIYI